MPPSDGKAFNQDTHFQMSLSAIHFNDVHISNLSRKKPFKKKMTLAVVAQWIECWPANQRVPGSISSQGTCLGCRPGPQGDRGGGGA